MADDELWQKGIRWMLRGLTHILAYRIVYYYFLIGHSDVTDLFSLLRYMTSSYALILRLSGLFHFIVGLLCLFGLNLPQVFNNYFLATSFTDLWRRINIYWREFMLKIFFYPIMFKLKKRVTHNLLAVTMLHVFVISWILHCYQLFWIQGSYQFNILDLAFWLILGGCITVNAVIQEKQSHIVVKERSVNIIYLFTIIKMLGMILFMSVMWSLWNSNTFTEWVYIMSNIRNCTIEDGILFFCGIVFVIGVGFITQIVLDKKIFKDLIGIKPQYTLFLTLPALLIILLCSFNVTKKVLPGSMYTFIKTIADEKLNRDDYNKVEDNYYKKLIDGEEGTVIGLWNLNFKTGKRNSTNAEIFIRTDGVFGKIYKPDLDVMINDKSFRTDSFGLRDKNYAFIKSSGTYRMALLGGSYEMGSGVDNDEVFETLVEKKLNSIYRDSTFSDFEIMNFAVGGFQAIQHIELCYTKVFQYKPDAVIYFAHSDEGMRLVNSFARLIYKKKNLKFPLLEFIKRTAVTPGMSESEISARLHPYEKVILKWAYSEISILCRKHNAIPVWVFLPTTTTTAANASVGELEVKKLATESYFVQIDLTGVYGSYDRKDIIISEWNTHPNGLGHVLIANKFYDELISNRKLIFTKNR
ncbi:MAG: uncharacterized protein K0S26_1146 [Bacteroidota bacterium]|nr:uncharacterized protein [Bacteroidota bacterium]